MDENFQELLFPPLAPPLHNSTSQSDLPTRRKDTPSLTAPAATITLLKDSNHNCHDPNQNAHGICTATTTKKNMAPQLPKPSKETSSSLINNHKGSQNTCEDENSSYLKEAKVIRNGSLLLDHSARMTSAQNPTQSSRIKKHEKKPNGLWKLFQKHTKVSPEITQSCDEDKNDTMDSIWGAIKSEKPEVKNLNISETLVQSSQYKKDEIHSECSHSKPAATSILERLKSITFEETLVIAFKGGLRREPYMSLEELNAKFEAFIDNSRIERKLQRQESEWRYQEMMKRSL